MQIRSVEDIDLAVRKTCEHPFCRPGIAEDFVSRAFFDSLDLDFVHLSIRGGRDDMQVGLGKIRREQCFPIGRNDDALSPVVQPATMPIIFRDLRSITLMNGLSFLLAT